jgi:hypothetical protein
VFYLGCSGNTWVGTEHLPKQTHGRKGLEQVCALPREVNLCCNCALVLAAMWWDHQKAAGVFCTAMSTGLSRPRGCKVSGCMHAERSGASDETPELQHATKAGGLSHRACNDLLTGKRAFLCTKPHEAAAAAHLMRSTRCTSLLSRVTRRGMNVSICRHNHTILRPPAKGQASAAMILAMPPS